MSLLNSSLSVIFDLDGTLVDSLPGITRSIQHALRVYDVAVTPGQVRELIGPPIKDVLRKIASSASEAELILVEQDFRAAYDSNGWKETNPFPSTQETLQRLQQLGVRLFLFTNKPEKAATRIVSKLDLDRFFVDRFSKDSREPAFKSKDEMLQELMTKHSLSAETCIVVGDSHEDFQAARKLSIRFVFANYGYGQLSPEDRNISVRQIDNLSAMLSL